MPQAGAQEVAPSRAKLASPASSLNVGYVEGLDHLRGFAAFLVLFHHGFWVALGMRTPPPISWANWPKAQNPLFAPIIEAHVAVTIFFVLSGFIFTLVGYDKTIAYGGYMRNRALRVLPVFLTALFFGIALFPERFEWQAFLATATIFADMGDAALQLHPVSTAFWTVAIEVQFYLIFPFLIAIMTKEGTRPLLWMIALLLGLRTVGFVLGDSIRDLNYWHLIPGRLDTFLIGMLGARVYMRWRQDPRADRLGPASPLIGGWVRALRERPWASLACGLIAFVSWEWFVSQSGGYPKQAWWKIWAPTWEALSCLLLVMGYLAVAPRIRPRLKRVFAFFGDMSFSTYICHFMIVGVVIGDPRQRERMPGMMLPFDQWIPGITPMLDAALNTLVLVFPAAIALSVLFFNGVERPFMRLRRRYVEAREAPAPTRERGNDARASA